MRIIDALLDYDGPCTTVSMPLCPKSDTSLIPNMNEPPKPDKRAQGVAGLLDGAVYVPPKWHPPGHFRIGFWTWPEVKYIRQVAESG